MASRRTKLLLAFSLLGVAVAAGYLLTGRKSPEVIAAEQALDRRDFTAAVEALERYLRANPDDAEARFLAARTTRRMGDFDAAVAHLKNLSREPGQEPRVALETELGRAQRGDLRAANALAASHLDGGNTAETAFVAEAVAVGILFHFSPIPGTGEILPPEQAPVLAMGHRAAERWRELRGGVEDQAAGLVWRGRLRQLGGDHPAAVEDFRSALRLHPDSFDARFHLAVAITQSAPAEAATHMAALLERAPGSIEVRYGLVNLYRSLGRLDEAGRVLDYLITANPKDAMALVERGVLAVDAGRPAEAEPLLRRALELRPDYPQVHLALSRCLQLTGQTDQAKMHFERFHRLESEQSSRPHDSNPPTPKLP